MLASMLFLESSLQARAVTLTFPTVSAGIVSECLWCVVCGVCGVCVCPLQRRRGIRRWNEEAGAKQCRWQELYKGHSVAARLVYPPRLVWWGSYDAGTAATPHRGDRSEDGLRAPAPSPMFRPKVAWSSGEPRIVAMWRASACDWAASRAILACCGRRQSVADDIATSGEGGKAEGDGTATRSASVAGQQRTQRLKSRGRALAASVKRRGMQVQGEC